jgi:ATP-binding cassette subfamily C protein CydC
MLQDRPFLILDEPMVNLDQPTLRDLSSMLLTKFSEKGILWITHTYESLERMDEILYIENGRILERGDHASLLARNGNYALLYKKQQLIPD